MSEVDRYLDEMFDRLAGTGAAGRRALAEAEDHLRAAVADGLARNLTAQQAEHDAVARFGPPATIARQLRRAHGGARLNPAFSGAWLLAGLGLAWLGAVYLATAASFAVILRMHPDSLPTCSANVNRVCTAAVPVMQSAVAGLVVVLLGGIVLLGRRLARRSAGLAAAARRLPLLAATLFTLAGLALFAETFVLPGVRRFAPATAGFSLVPQGPGLRMTLIASVLGMAAALVTAAWGRTQARRPRYPQ
jgi:hypothetical protein